MIHPRIGDSLVSKIGARLRRGPLPDALKCTPSSIFETQCFFGLAALANIDYIAERSKGNGLKYVSTQPA
jgi:hypothetical protein